MTPTAASTVVLTALAVMLLTVGASAADDAAAWVDVSPDGEPFRVQMPAAPTRKEAESSTIVGIVQRVAYYTAQDGHSFSANRIDLPGIATMIMSDESLFENVREGLLKNDSATATSYEDVKRDGRAGKRLVFSKTDDTGPREARAEFYLVDDWMVSFVGAVPAGTSTAGVERFLKSVRLPPQE